MRVYIKKSVSASFEQIETPDKELGKGGQARVYKISTRGYEEYCLKIFIRVADAKKNYERLAYMIQHPPKNIMGSSNFRICWPTAFAYDENKNFIGYVMPLAFPKSRDLKILEVYNAKPISQQAKYKKYPDWFDKFELDTNEGLKNRMKMLCNWAIAIHALHETHKYVIVDLKPENVMATSSGKISIVDTDSFQISENNKILYPGAAYTPPYFPPEGKALQANNIPFSISCDLFAAAVCFYKILTGVHPYGGTIKKYPYDKLETEEEFIGAGLFAYGDKKQYLSFPSGFNLHQNYNNLSSTIQHLFVRAFGSNPNIRPSMEEWGKALYDAAMDSNSIVRSVVKPTKSNSLAIKITNVAFADGDYNGNIKNNFGDKLYTDVEYLMPKVTYQVLKKGSPVKIGCKIYAPNGQVLADGDAKSGYFYTLSLPCDTQSTITQTMGGLGNQNKDLYNQTGTYHVEFYQDDKCLYKTSFEIFSKSNIPTPSRPYSSTPSSYSSRNSKFSLNDAVANIGYWFEEKGEDASVVVSIIIAAIPVIGILIGIIKVFVEEGIFWGILSAIFGGGLACTIAYVVFLAGAFITNVLFKILRYIFYNLYVLLLFILIPVGIVVATQISDRQDSSTVKTTTISNKIYYCTATSGLNVRYTPSTNSKVVGKLKHGEAVEVLEKGTSFTKISYKHSRGETAWVSTKYLSATKPSTTTTTEKKKTTSNNSATTTSAKTSKTTTSSSSTQTTTKASSSKSSTSTTSTILFVDSKTSLNYRLSSSSGQRIFTVATGESDYQIASKPSWCTILRKSKKQFEIKYDANPKNVERSGTIQVKSGDAMVPIVLVQSAGTGNTTSTSSKTTSSTTAAKASAMTNSMEHSHAEATITVTGKVVSAKDGQPVIGASVLEKGTTNGTITDFDGIYELTVAKDAVLEFQYVGLASQSLKVTGSKMDVTLSKIRR